MDEATLPLNIWSPPPRPQVCIRALGGGDVEIDADRLLFNHRPLCKPTSPHLLPVLQARWARDRVETVSRPRHLSRTPFTHITGTFTIHTPTIHTECSQAIVTDTHRASYLVTPSYSATLENQLAREPLPLSDARAIFRQP